MSYLRDKLKQALGLNKADNDKKFITDWTPNGIRSIIIAKNYILVAKHLGVSAGCVKKTDLDIAQVAQDLEKSNSHYGNPKINTTLLKRSLSCLEEMYIDSVYLNYPKMIDLVGYAKEMGKSTSRIRFIGHGNFPESGLDVYLNRAYAENRRKLDYAIATDENLPIKLTGVATKNDLWYTKYMLRPTYYKLDAPKGELSLHFAKIERDYTKQLETIRKDAKGKSLEEQVMYISQCDERNVLVFHRIDGMLETLSRNKKDKVCNMAFNEWKKVISGLKPFEGLSQSWVDKLFTDRYMVLVYKRYNVVYTGSKGLSEDRVRETFELGKGFINIANVLDEFCIRVSDRLMEMGLGDLVGFSLSVNDGFIPDGEFRSRFIKNEVGVYDVDGYFVYLSDVLGGKF